MIDSAPKCNGKIDYFLIEPNRQADMELRAKITKSIHQKFANVFSCIGCTKAHFHYR